MPDMSWFHSYEFMVLPHRKTKIIMSWYRYYSQVVSRLPMLTAGVAGGGGVNDDSGDDTARQLFVRCSCTCLTYLLLFSAPSLPLRSVLHSHITPSSSLTTLAIHLLYCDIILSSFLSPHHNIGSFYFVVSPTHHHRAPHAHSHDIIYPSIFSSSERGGTEQQCPPPPPPPPPGRRR